MRIRISWDEWRGRSGFGRYADGRKLNKRGHFFLA